MLYFLNKRINHMMLYRMRLYANRTTKQFYRKSVWYRNRVKFYSYLFLSAHIPSGHWGVEKDIESHPIINTLRYCAMASSPVVGNPLFRLWWAICYLVGRRWTEPPTTSERQITFTETSAIRFFRRMFDDKTSHSKPLIEYQMHQN